MRAQSGPYRTSDILQATRGVLLRGGAEVCFDAISTDSRDIQPGDLFVALRGEHFDGHDFLIPALEAGARGSLVAADVNRDFLPYSSSFVLIQVQDTLRALSDLASAHRTYYHAPLIAVTGSSGKTTTKEMIAAILRLTHTPLVSAGNLNNLIGLPMTVLALDGTHTAAVVEAGINTKGEMEQLARAARADAAAITCIGPVHLEGLGDVASVAREKFRLVESLSPSGTAILPFEEPHLKPLLHRCRARISTFGADGADFSARDVSAAAQTSFTLVSPLGSERISLAAPGRHNVSNALCAAAACAALGTTLDVIAEGLRRFRAPAWRMETAPLPDGRTLIQDCYNANPQSVAAALRALVDCGGGLPTMAILADMMELGAQAQMHHEKIGKMCAELGVDHCVFVGSFRESFARGFLAGGGRPSQLAVAADHETAWEAVRDRLPQFHTILVKGSRRMKMEIIADKIRGEN